MKRLPAICIAIGLTYVPGTHLCRASPQARCHPSKAQPSVQAVIKTAMGQPELASRRSSWLTRLRLRPLLPRLSFRLAFSHGLASFYDWNPDAPDDLDANLRDLRNWEVRAVWDLGPLLFDNREPAIERTSRRHADRRRKLAAEIVDLYYERGRLLQQLCGDEPAEYDPPQLRLLLRRASALLWVLSGHRFYASQR